MYGFILKNSRLKSNQSKIEIKLWLLGALISLQHGFCLATFFPMSENLVLVLYVLLVLASKLYLK